MVDGLVLLGINKVHGLKATLARQIRCQFGSMVWPSNMIVVLTVWSLADLVSLCEVRQGDSFDLSSYSPVAFVIYDSASILLR